MNMVAEEERKTEKASWCNINRINNSGPGVVIKPFSYITYHRFAVGVGGVCGRHGPSVQRQKFWKVFLCFPPYTFFAYINPLPVAAVSEPVEILKSQCLSLILDTYQAWALTFSEFLQGNLDAKFKFECWQKFTKVLSRVFIGLINDWILNKSSSNARKSSQKFSL